MVRYVLVGVAIAIASLAHAPAASANPVCQTVDVDKPNDQPPVSLCLPSPYGTTCNGQHLVVGSTVDAWITNCVPSLVGP